MRLEQRREALAYAAFEVGGNPFGELSDERIEGSGGGGRPSVLAPRLTASRDWSEPSPRYTRYTVRSDRWM